MGLSGALRARRVHGEIALKPVGELSKTCCPKSSLEVYDFDAYAARTLHGTTPATCDGVWVRSGDVEFLVLLELKSIKNMRREFGRTRTGKKFADDEAEVAAYAEFVKRKLLGYDLQKKLDGTRGLLSEMDGELDAGIRNGEISARFLLVFDLDSREIINFHSTLKSVLDKIACPRWRPPAYTQCAKIRDEAAMAALFDGNPGE